MLTDQLALTDLDDIRVTDVTNEPLLVAVISDFKKWRVGLGIRDLNGLYLGVIYERQKAIDFLNKTFFGEDNAANLRQGQIGYVFDDNMIKGMYGKNKPDNSTSNEANSWAVGFDHNFSKHTKAYAVYTEVDTDASSPHYGDWKGFSLGMIHNFRARAPTNCTNTQEVITRLLTLRLPLWPSGFCCWRTTAAAPSPTATRAAAIRKVKSSVYRLST